MQGGREGGRGEDEGLELEESAQKQWGPEGRVSRSSWSPRMSKNAPGSNTFGKKAFKNRKNFSEEEMLKLYVLNINQGDQSVKAQAFPLMKSLHMNASLGRVSLCD